MVALLVFIIATLELRQQPAITMNIPVIVNYNYFTLYKASSVTLKII